MPLLGSLGNLRSNFLTTIGTAQGTGWGLGMTKFSDAYDYKFFEILTDTSGNLYAIGNYNSGIDIEDYASIVKFDSLGNIVWNKGFTIAGVTTNPVFTNAKLDNSGNLVISGTYGSGTSTIVFVTKIASDGSIITTKSMPNRTLVTGEFAIDSSNNIFVQHRITTSQYLISKYDPSLNLINQITVTKPTTFTSFGTFRIQVDKNDNVIVGGGGFYSTQSNNAYLTASINNTLTTVSYSTCHYNSSQNFGIPNVMKIDDNNGICFLQSGSGYMMGVHNNGTAQWASRVIGSYGSYTNMYLTGSYAYLSDYTLSAGVEGPPSTITKINPISGNVLWAKRLQIDYTKNLTNSRHTYLSGIGYYNNHIYCGGAWATDAGVPNFPTAMPMICKLPSNGAIPGIGTYTDGIISTGKYDVVYSNESTTVTYYSVSTSNEAITLGSYSGNIGNVTSVTGSTFNVSTTTNTLIPFV